MSIEVNATEQIIEVNATGSTIDINVTSQTVDVNATTSVIDVNVTNGPGPGVPDGGLTGQVLKKQSDTDYDTYWAADTVGVPYVGATGNVDLGEYELKAGQLTLDTSPTGTASVGTTRWNDSIGSSETTLKGGSVILKNGVDLVARVVNKVTPNTTLTKAAYQAVRVSGAQGQRLAVAFAQANNDNNSADTIGLVTETIATNQEGFIMTVGNLEDINTTGSLQGETWADGDVLYLSPTVAGAITNIKPVAPQHLVVIGYVEYAHANHGKIYVKIMNGWELGELHDVDTTGATAGQVLKYNGTIWTPSSDLDTGITSLNGLTALTQTFATGTSGTDFNISSATSTHTFNLPTASATNRGLVSSSDWSTFNAKIGGTLATGQVAFGSAANTISGSNNLFWDNTNGRLGIGTNAPAYIVDIVSTSTPNLRITRSGQTDLRLGSSVLATGAVIGTYTNSPLSFLTNSTTRVYITEGGNTIIGGTTDSGQRLQVQGDAFIKGSGNTSGTTALTVQNSDGTNILRVRNDATFVIGNHASQNTLIFPFATTTGVVDTTGRNLQFYNQSISSVPTNGAFYFTGVSFAPTSGASLFVNIANTFAPTSGTGTIAYLNIGSTINQTGGASGITRGLYVNPTLTAAADWRSIEWSNTTGYGLYGAGSALNYISGRIAFGTALPSSTVHLTLNGQITGGVLSYGMLQTGFVRSDVTTYGVGIGNRLNKSDANTLPAYYNFFAIGGGSISGAVTNEYGFSVGAGMTGATNSYGFYGDLAASGTNRWNLYCNGSANNYMAGSLGVGSTTLTGITLRLSKALTGAVTSYGVYNECQILSDVTNQVSYFQSQANTQAAAFTLSNLYHYLANQSQIGAGSSVTNQYGFFANSNITGATNNFGFYGNIASGTGRWNAYMSGTAANYLNGNTIIGGSAVDGGQKLQVNGDTIMTGSGNTSATTALNVRNSDNRIIIRATNNGVLQIGNLNANSIYPFSSSVGTPDIQGTSLAISTNLSTSGNGIGIRNAQVTNRDYTSGDGNFVRLYEGYAPTSGTGTWQQLILTPQINQTGGANGITRGLYINPTLTSAADFRAIEVSAGTTVLAASVAARSSLRIPSGTAPTSPVDGDIWFDGTDLKMRIGGVTKTFTLV